ncbi:MAG: glycosyltransferase [Anaerolineales bacterium]|nr:glycosyltransferase [Anaerolineales bacterium]
MKILYLTIELPWPPDRGARIRDFNLIKQVSRRHDVFLLSLLDSTGQPADSSALEPYCQWIETVELKQRAMADHLKALRSCVRHGRPLAVYDYYRQELAEKLANLVGDSDIDIIQFEHSFFAPYIDVLPKGYKGKTVLDFHNIGFLQYRRMANLELGWREKAGFRIKSLLMNNWEGRYAQRFHHCLATSEIDAALLKTRAPNLNVTVIPNGVDTGTIQQLDESPESLTLLIIGTIGYPPNRDSAFYFFRDIFPLIERQIPEVKLLIAGHSPPKKVEELGRHENIEVPGSISDVLPLYQKSLITVVPLRGGSGTRLKIIESMAMGRPVVSTTIGCEGLDVVDGKHLLIADSPLDFANAVIQLLQNRDLRARIIANARRLVETHYDWKTIGEKLLSVYQEIDINKG